LQVFRYSSYWCKVLSSVSELMSLTKCIITIITITIIIIIIIIIIINIDTVAVGNVVMMMIMIWQYIWVLSPRAGSSCSGTCDLSPSITKQESHGIWPTFPLDEF
jgi:hypothetical protein